MRTLNFPQSNNLFYSQPELNLSALASMLSQQQQSLQQQSLLAKRPNPAFESMLLQDTIQKKLKNNYMQGLPQQHQQQAFAPNLSNFLFQDNTPSQRFPEQMSFMNLPRFQQAPVTTLVKPVPSHFPQNFHFPTKKLELETVKPVMNKSLVKEEYVSEQDLTTAHGSPLSNSKTSPSATPSNRSVSKVIKKKTAPVVANTSSLVDGPVLGEFTQTFPDWDLATIFTFLNGEKSMDAFEAELQKKQQRKLARKPVQRRSKKQNLKKFE